MALIPNPLGRWLSVGSVALLALGGCGSTTQEVTQSGHTIASASSLPPTGVRRAYTRNAGASGDPGRIEVNGFLWRGALDALSFMPLQSADPYGGIIITDWYSPPETPNERFKVNALVQGSELRAEGVKVTMFRQTRDGGGWQEAALDKNTALDLENVILARARDLRQQRLVD